MAEFQSHRFETPLKRVRGLGAAHTGTDHFWRIRLTSLAQVPLTIAFLVIVLATVGKGRDAALATLSHPLVALLMLLVGIVTLKVIIGFFIIIVGLLVFWPIIRRGIDTQRVPHAMKI